MCIIIGPCLEKTCLWGFANSKDADQPAKSDQRLYYSLFGKYQIKVCHKRIFNFQAVPVAEQADLKLALSEVPKTGILTSWLIYFRYRSKAYDDLYQENLILKGQVEGTSKENVILAGKIRQNENRVLQKRKQRRDSK